MNNSMFSYKTCKYAASALETAIRAGKGGSYKLVKAAIKSDVELIKLKTKDAPIDIQKRADRTIQALIQQGRVYGRTTHNMEVYY